MEMLLLKIFDKYKFPLNYIAFPYKVINPSVIIGIKLLDILFIIQ